MKLRFIEPGSVLYKILLSIFYFVLKLWMWSIRKVYRGNTNVLARENKGNVIIAFWHDCLLGVSFLFPQHCKEKSTAITSRSQDGQLIADLLEKQGLQTIRGSANSKGKDKGGARAFLQSLRVLAKPQTFLCIVPDGPKGPAHKAHSGAVVLSAKAHCPIIPVYVSFSHYFCLPSWDKLRVPLPFTKAEVILGEELAFDREQVSSDSKLIEANGELESALNNLRND